jgi:hypothetical protein
MATVDVKFESMANFGQNFGQAAATTYTTGYSLWAAAAGLILAGVGAYKQYQMYSQMGDLAASQQKLVDSQRARYEKQMDSIYLPNLKQARENLWSYGLPYAKSITEAVVACATKACEYARRKTNTTLAAGRVATIMNAARRTARRSMNPRATGVCCDNESRLAAMQAALVVSESIVNDRYEDALELQWNQFYMNRMNLGAQLAQRMGELSSNMAVAAATQLSSVMGGLSQALSVGQQGIQQQGAALQGMGQVFGGLGSIGGILAGNSMGAAAGSQLFGGIGRTAPSAGMGNMQIVPFNLIDGAMAAPAAATDLNNGNDVGLTAY